MGHATLAEALLERGIPEPIDAASFNYTAAFVRLVDFDLIFVVVDPDLLRGVRIVRGHVVIGSYRSARLHSFASLLDGSHAPRRSTHKAPHKQLLPLNKLLLNKMVLTRAFLITIVSHGFLLSLSSLSLKARWPKSLYQAH